MGNKNMAEKKEPKKMMVHSPNLKTATREEKDNFISILDYYIGLREEEIKAEAI